MKQFFVRNKVRILISFAILTILFIGGLFSAAYYLLIYRNDPEVVLNQGTAEIDSYKSFTSKYVSEQRVQVTIDETTTGYTQTFSADLQSNLTGNNSAMISNASSTDKDNNVTKGIKMYTDDSSTFIDYKNVSSNLIIQRPEMLWVQIDKSANQPELDSTITTLIDSSFGLKGSDYIKVINSKNANFKSKKDSLYTYEVTLDKNFVKSYLLDQLSESNRKAIEPTLSVGDSKVIFVMNRSTNAPVSIEVLFADVYFSTTNNGVKSDVTTTINRKNDSIVLFKSPLNITKPEDKEVINVDQYYSDATLTPLKETKGTASNPSAVKASKVSLTMMVPFGEPFSVKFGHDTFPRIKENYIDKDQILYTILPVDMDFPPYTDYREPDYKAYLCSSEQNKGIEFYQAMNSASYLLLNDTSLPRPVHNNDWYVNLVENNKIALDSKTFRNCLTADKYKKVYKKLVDKITPKIIEGVPQFDITSTTNQADVIQGAYPFEEFAKKLDAALIK